MRKVGARKHFGRKTKRNAAGWTKFEVAILEMKPGDTLVFRTDLMLTRPQVEEFRERLRQDFPGIRTVIVTSGMSLAVVRDKAA